VVANVRNVAVVANHNADNYYNIAAVTCEDDEVEK